MSTLLELRGVEKRYDNGTLALERVDLSVYESVYFCNTPRYADDLPEEARKQLHTLGYNTGQMSVDIFEAPAAAQSWFVLNRIKDIVEA